MVEQAKIFKGLRLGSVNPAEALLGDVTSQFEQNITTALKQFVGRDLTDSEKNAVTEAARLQAEALIEPNKLQEVNNERLGALNTSVQNLTQTLNDQGMLDDAIAAGIADGLGQRLGGNTPNQPNLVKPEADVPIDPKNSMVSPAGRTSPDPEYTKPKPQQSDMVPLPAGGNRTEPGKLSKVPGTNFPVPSDQGGIPLPKFPEQPKLLPNPPAARPNNIQPPLSNEEINNYRRQITEELLPELEDLKSDRFNEDFRRNFEQRLGELQQEFFDGTRGKAEGKAQGRLRELFDEFRQKNLPPLDSQPFPPASPSGPGNVLNVGQFNKFVNAGLTKGSLETHDRHAEEKIEKLGVAVRDASGQRFSSAGVYGDQRQEDRMLRNLARTTGDLPEGKKTLFKYNEKGERTGVHTPNIPTAVMQSGLTISEVARMAEQHGISDLSEEEREVLKAHGYNVSGKGPIVPEGKPGRKARANERRAKLIPQGEMSPSNPSVQRKLAEERENIDKAQQPPKTTIPQIKPATKINLLDAEAAFDDYIKQVIKSDESRAARSIKAAIERRGQIDTELGSALTEISTNLNVGLITESETAMKAFSNAMIQARDAGVDVTKIEEIRKNLIEDITTAEGTLGETRLNALRAIKKLTTEEAAKDLKERQEEFDKNLASNTQLREAAQAKLNARLEEGQATLADISNVIAADMSYNLNSFTRDLSDGLIDISNTFKEGTKQAIGEAIRGTSTLKEAFSKVFQTIADKAMDKSISMAVDSLFSGVRESFFAKGGFVKGYNSGGMVSGGSGYKDDVPAMLTRGEYVMRKSAVNKYGEEFFQKLNTGGMAKEVRTARSADIRLLNEYLYNDPKRPTSGRFNEDQRLSAFGRRNEDDRRNVIKFERERALKDYIQARDAHYAEQDKIQQQFKDQLKGRRRSAIIGAGLSIGTSAVLNASQGKDLFGRKGIM